MRNPADAVAQSLEVRLKALRRRVLRQKLKMSEQARDGRAQLMRGVGDELALRVGGLAQYFKEPIQSINQWSYFGWHGRGFKRPQLARRTRLDLAAHRR